MHKINWISKLTSRKWWTSIASFVTLLIVAFGGTESTATQVAAIIMAGAIVIGYTVGEGLVDAANKVPEGELIELEGATDEKDM